MAAWALAGFVSACAGVPRDASLPINDPNEQFNRGVLRVNQAVLDPASNVVKQVPGPIRDRLEDLDSNLKEPRVFANNILQGRFNAAGNHPWPSRLQLDLRTRRVSSTWLQQAGCRSRAAISARPCSSTASRPARFVNTPYLRPLDAA